MAWFGQRGINGVPVQPVQAGLCDVAVLQEPALELWIYFLFLSHSLYKRAFYSVYLSENVIKIYVDMKLCLCA